MREFCVFKTATASARGYADAGALPEAPAEQDWIDLRCALKTAGLLIRLSPAEKRWYLFAFCGYMRAKRDGRQ